MVQYVSTPWCDRPELLLVRQQLYISPTNQDDKLQAQHQAVARVSMWMQRGNCPHMVESTALLTAAMLSDDEVAGSANAASSTYAIRAAYAAAFSRFVTGLLDGHQDKLRKQSMFAIAKTIGLPATFVELRHQATHEQLPPLAKLRTAAQKALAWIWDYYWKHLGEDPCKEAVLAYLQEEDTTRSQTLRKELGRWPKTQMLATIAELRDSLPGNKVFLKCSELSQLLEADSSGLLGQGLAMESDRRPTSDEQDWCLYQGPWKSKPIGTV